jgi:hypothetical protein
MAGRWLDGLLEWIGSRRPPAARSSGAEQRPSPSDLARRYRLYHLRQNTNSQAPRGATFVEDRVLKDSAHMNGRTLIAAAIALGFVSLIWTPAVSGAGEEPILDGAPSQSPVLWESAMFWRIPGGGVGGGRYLTEAILMATSPHGYWYLEREAIEQWGMNYTLEEMATITSSFEDVVRPRTHAAFGVEPTPPMDIDNDERITVLITRNMGVFDSRNELPKTLDPESNAREMVYVPFQRDLTSFLATLTHEFNHLVHWNYHRGVEEAFVSEGLAMVSQTVAGYGGSLADYYLANTSVGLLDDGNDFYSDYGGWELLVQYMMDRFGGWAFSRALTQNPLPGAEGIESTLSTLGYTLDFRTLFEDWMVTNLVNEATSEGRRFKYANMTHTAGVLVEAGGSSWSWDGTLEKGGVMYVRVPPRQSPVRILLSNASPETVIAAIVLRNGPQIRILPSVLAPPHSLVIEAPIGGANETATLAVAYLNLTGTIEKDLSIIIADVHEPGFQLPLPAAATLVAIGAAVSGLLAFALLRRRGNKPLRGLEGQSIQGGPKDGEGDRIG